MSYFKSMVKNDGQQTINTAPSRGTSKGYPPTVREIADHMHYQSSSTAFQLLEMLVRKEFIKKGNGSRELQIIGFETMTEKDAEIARLREENELLWKELNLKR